MKVFHLLSGSPYGGVELQIERLAQLFEQNGVEQRALLAENSGRAQRLAAIGVIPVEIPFPGRFAFIDRRRINTTVRRFGPDIAISWTPDVAALVEKGDFIHVGRLGAGAPLGAFARCDRLFTPAAARAEAATTMGWLADKVKVLPHLPPAPGPVQPANRKTYYTPPTAKLVVTALRLNRDSGLEVLLEAISRLSGYYLWIVGDGADRAELENLAHERGVKPRVRFLGWQDDLAPFVAAADVFVCPARNEDVGETVTEAWSGAAPVIAADSIGPGLLIRHKENGVLVPVGDAISMAEAIKWVCQDQALAKQIGAAGKASFDAAYSADKVAPQYLEFFTVLAVKA